MSEIDGVEVMVNRTGYTGEEGLRAACDGRGRGRAVGRRARARRRAVRARRARHLAARGLLPAARKRHHDGDDPISAGLGWACALDKDFTGADVLRRIKAEGPERKLVAFVMEDKAIPGRECRSRASGEVTSGSHSPMLDVGIGMGYVPAGSSTPDTELTIDVRGRPRPCPCRPKPIYRREERA